MGVFTVPTSSTAAAANLPALGVWVVVAKILVMGDIDARQCPVRVPWPRTGERGVRILVIVRTGAAAAEVPALARCAGGAVGAERAHYAIGARAAIRDDGLAGRELETRVLTAVAWFVLAVVPWHPGRVPAGADDDVVVPRH